MAAPQITTNRLDLEEGQIIPISTSELNANAVGVSTTDIRFEILPVIGPEGESLLAGTFLLSDAPVSEFSLEDILLGQVEFRHDRSNVAPQYTVTARVAEEVSEISTPDIEFTARNDSPIFSRNELTISEDETVTLNANPEALNLVTKDEESPAEQLTYEILSVSNGDFLSGAGDAAVVLNVADTFTQADVDAGLIQFRHDGSETAPNYDLRVVDAGIPDDTTPKGSRREVVLQDFLRINDPPSITANTLTLTEGDTVVLESQNLAAEDTEDEDATLTFLITAVTGGRFELLTPDGAVVSVLAAPDTAPVPFTQESILQGLVQFVNEPATDEPPTYTVQVLDSDPDSVPSVEQAATVNYTKVNDVPLLQTVALTIAEDEQVPLTPDNLLVTDEESSAEALTYEVDEVIAGRFVRISDGTTVASFTQAEIDTGNTIAFEHDGSILPPEFTLEVTDGDGAMVEVVSGDAIQFTAFNDVPEIKQAQLTLAEEDIVTLTSADNLLVTDEESGPSELLYTVQINNADSPQPDRFIINGVEVTDATVTFTQADVNAGLVQFVHGGSNDAPDLTVTVSDAPLSDTDTGNSVPVELAIAFDAKNDEPNFTTNALIIEEGQTVVLNSNPDALNVITTDEESTAAELTYAIESVSNGTFQLLGGETSADLAVGDTFTQADVDGGLIQFTHDDSELAPDYRLKVTDSGLNGDATTALSVSRDLQIPEGGFTLINDQPTLVNNTLTLNEGDVVDLDSDNLSAIDPEDNDADLIFTVTNVTNGRFERVTSVDGVEQIEILASSDADAPSLGFTQDDVQQGRIRFVNDPATNDAPTYTVTVSDLGTPPLTDSREADVEYTALNDAPLFSLNTLIISEGGTVILNSDVAAPNLVTTDEETPPEQLIYTIDSVENGTFQRLEGEAPTDLAIGGTFSQADVDGGLIQFVHDDSEFAPDYSLTVKDTGLDGEPDTAITVTRDLVIPEGGFTLINDAPEFVNNTLTLTEDETVVLTSDNLSATDSEDEDAALLFTVTTITNGRFERVVGEEVTILAASDATPVSFAQSDIEQGLIRFVNDPGTDLAPTYTVEVKDLDPENPQTATSDAVIEFTKINDEPELTVFSLTLVEDDVVPLTSEILSVVDEELGADVLTYTVDEVIGGRFVRVADDTTATTFTQAEIDAGTVIAFEQDGGNDAPTFSLLVNDDVNQLEITEESGEGVTFSSTNDAPIVEASAFTVEEGGTVLLTETLLKTTDEETPPEELTYTVEIANADLAQPDGFEINGTLLTDAIITFTQAQVNAGQVTFVQGGSNSMPDLTLTVTDTLNSDLGEPITVEVPLQADANLSNDLPTITNVLQISEGDTVTLTPDLLSAVDEETQLPEEITYTVESVLNGSFQTFDPAQGKATGPIEVGGTFTQADVNNGTIQFVHNGDEAAPSYTLQIADMPTVPGGEPNIISSVVEIPEGGFTNVNDDPALEVNALTIKEGDTVVFSGSNLLASDPDSELSQITFEINDITGGTFFLNGVELIEGKTFTTAALSFSELSFVDDGDEIAPSYTVTARDPEGGASLPAAADVSFEQSNDPPVFTQNFFEIVEGERLTLNDPATGGFNLQAADSEATSDADITFEVSNVTGGAFLDFLAQPVTQFTQAELNAGNINFQHDGTETLPTFEVTVFDSEGASVTAAPGINFIGVNDPPVLGNSQLTPVEATLIDLTTENFSATDSDTSPEGLTFLISDLVGGTFGVRNGDVTAPTDNFTLAQVAAGQVVFFSDEDQIPPSFNVSVSDGEFQTDAIAASVGDLVNTNDAPIAADDGGFGFSTDEQTAFTTGDVLLNDIDEDPGDELSIVQLNGQLADFNVGIPLPSGGFVSFASGGNINYAPAPQFAGLSSGETATDSFTYTVSDTAGTTSTATVTIEIAGINNAPSLDVNRLSISLGQTLILSNNNLLVSDPDTADEALTIAVSNVLGGQFFLNGEVTSSFTQQDIVNGAVSFVQDGSLTPPSYNVIVSDGATSTEAATVAVDQFVPVDLAAIVGGVVDHEQFLRLQSPDAVIPTDTINELPLAQLFDESFYLQQNPDVVDAIEAGLVASGYDHFITSGIAEGRNPSILYNNDFYLANNADVAAAVENGIFQSGLQHFLTDGVDQLRSPSAQFSQVEYLDANPDVLTAIGQGSFSNGFEHYVQFGADENRVPFRYLYTEEFYLSNNPEVAQGVQSGAFVDGFEHFVSFGQQEGRQPSVLYNEATYLAANPDVAAQVAGGTFVSGFEHYGQFGRFEQRAVFI